MNDQAINKQLENYASALATTFRTGSGPGGAVKPAEKLAAAIQHLTNKEVEAMTAATAAAQHAAILGRVMETNTVKVSNMLASILAIPGIEQVWTHANGIQILTGRLCSVDQRTGRTHLIANHMLLDLPVAHQKMTEDIRMYNLSLNIIGANGNQHAPHVLSSGQPCLGNGGEIMMEAIETGNLPALVYIILEFITTAYTADAAGRNVALFPIIQPDGSLAIVSQKPLIPPGRLPMHLIDKIPQLETKYLCDGLSIAEWELMWRSLPTAALPKNVHVHSDALS